MQESDEEPKFNHDLLKYEEDRANAREQYPSLVDALYHPQLVEYFGQFDEPANKAKRDSRDLGTKAILFGGLAIFAAAIEVAFVRVSPLLFAEPEKCANSLCPSSIEVGFLLVIGAFAAVCGLYSLYLGYFGTLFGRRKQSWLMNRFMGERIRQFHFQSLLAQLPMVLAMASAIEENGPGAAKAMEAKDDFLKNRDLQFAAFLEEFNKLGRSAKFQDMVAASEGDALLCEQQDTRLAPEISPQLESFFKAYRALRIQHQYDYANYKLMDDPKILSDTPQRQSELLEKVTQGTILLVTLIHACVLGVVVVALAYWFVELVRWLAGLRSPQPPDLLTPSAIRTSAAAINIQPG